MSLKKGGGADEQNFKILSKDGMGITELVPLGQAPPWLGKTLLHAILTGEQG